MSRIPKRTDPDPSTHRRSMLALSMAFAILFMWAPLPSPGAEGARTPCNNTLKITRSGDTLHILYNLQDAAGADYPFKRTDLRGAPGFKALYGDRLLASGTFTFG